ncbi:MAG: sigma-70 family RNA polymerase sigma factor [Bacteroidota bacterium]|nr:sigma-70 family RNA polymerase sigma factor [Bacteroidota bacterium]
MNISTSPYHFTKDDIKQEESIIELAKKDPAKFNVLYNKYFEQVFMYVLKRVETEDIAADITSQIFLKALSGLKNYKVQGLPFSSWLYAISRNEIYNQHKQRKINIVISINIEGMGIIAGEIVEENTIEDFSRLYAALKTLPEEDIELIEHRFFEKRPFKEISEILNITENNAKVKTYRAIDKLKKIMIK